MPLCYIPSAIPATKKDANLWLCPPWPISPMLMHPRRYCYYWYSHFSSCVWGQQHVPRHLLPLACYCFSFLRSTSYRKRLQRSVMVLSAGLRTPSPTARPPAKYTYTPTAGGACGTSVRVQKAETRNWSIWGLNVLHTLVVHLVHAWLTSTMMLSSCLTYTSFRCMHAWRTPLVPAVTPESTLR